MSVLTTLTKKLEDYAAAHTQSTETTMSTTSTPGTTTPTTTSKNETLVEKGYGLLDLFLYYMMNMVLFMILFVDLVVEFVNNCVHKYNIVSCSFKHKLYNNIN
ncbi:hypothetical protein Cantr_05855 [Candida viswanathii]|uniref:Uncharacterized protein n=1 Tax=Candida viswanathii TaxID=5486 RepID=A0A367XSN8_9ASCO|nr:hypothetical protein Cantr_05855 [Candida viswanathii]